MSLHGKVALVTGASRGIGRATALVLAERGADVVVHYRRREDQAWEVAEAIRGMGRRVEALPADLERPEEISALFRAVEERFGYLDIFVANAAATAFRPFEAIRAHHLVRTYQLNVFGFVQAAQEAMRLMRGRRGRIVAISGFPTQRYLPDYALLAGAKASVETLARYLAVEAAPLGINVNVVSPGAVDTESLDVYAQGDRETFDRATRLSTPKGRLGTPEDIAKVVAFLCSEDAEWIVGQTLVVDGGLTLMGAYRRRGEEA
ncbi:MAG: dehydrogenase [candidate division GAL15 bacterium]